METRVTFFSVTKSSVERKLDHQSYSVFLKIFPKAFFVLKITTRLGHKYPKSWLRIRRPLGYVPSQSGKIRMITPLLKSVISSLCFYRQWITLYKTPWPYFLLVVWLYAFLFRKIQWTLNNTEKHLNKLRNWRTTKEITKIIK